MLIILLVPNNVVEAKTLGDLKSELADLQKKYDENKNKKDLTDVEIKKYLVR